MTPNIDDLPRHVLVARLRRAEEDLDFQRRRHEAERATMANLLAETRTMRDTLTHAQTRGTELLELSRDASIIDEQVREFHELCGDVDPDVPTMPAEKIVRLRLRLVLEEAFELFAASVAKGVGGETSSDQDTVESLWAETRAAIDALTIFPDLVEIADALADIDYVVAGTRLAYGIQRKAVADEVHRSNMAKAHDGVILRDAKGKILKPEGWAPPNIRKALGLE